MNYYERHLGDYARDTAHLTMIEHGAYGLLLDRCYATEQGIPDGQAHRLARARTREEKAAVDSVLAEFFTLIDGHWINRRVTEEIDKAHRRIGAAKENGKRGGRPKKELSGYENETQQKPSGLFLGYENETQQKAHQAPDTRHHTKTIEQRIPVESSGQPEIEKTRAAAVGENSSGALATVLRKHGVTITPQHPVLLAWVKDGFTLQQMLEAVEVARMRKPDPEPIPPNYLDPILREPKTKKTSEPAWWATEQTMLAKGREVGCQPNMGEGWPEYRSRLNRIVQSKTARGDE